jgi:hypothetical protein
VDVILEIESVSSLRGSLLRGFLISLGQGKAVLFQQIVLFGGFENAHLLFFPISLYAGENRHFLAVSVPSVVKKAGNYPSRTGYSADFVGKHYLEEDHKNP